MDDPVFEIRFVECVGKLFAIAGDNGRVAEALRGIDDDDFVDPVSNFIIRAIRQTVGNNSGPAGVPEFVGVMRSMAMDEGFKALHKHPAWPAFGDLLMCHFRDAERELQQARECAEYIRRDARGRKLARLAAEVMAGNNAAETEELARRVASALDDAPAEGPELLTDVAAEMAAGGEVVRPVLCGMNWWDGPSGGLWPGLSVFAGRPGTGKSALALQLVAGALRHDRKQRAIWGLGEMTQRQIAERLGACFSGDYNQPVDMSEIREWSDLGRKAVMNITADIGDRLAIVADVSVGGLANAVARYDATILVLDYLQLIPGDGSQSQYERLEEAATDLLRLCRARDVCVLAISSISKSAGPDAAIGSLSKGSGSFDYAAGAFYLCEVPADADRSTGVYPVNIRCMKNRFGGLNDIQTHFNGNRQRFGLLEEEPAFNEWEPA